MLRQNIKTLNKHLKDNVGSALSEKVLIIVMAFVVGVVLMGVLVVAFQSDGPIANWLGTAIPHAIDGGAVTPGHKEDNSNCAHIYKNGTCIKCGYVCNHADSVTKLTCLGGEHCSICGNLLTGTAEHQAVNHVCALCNHIVYKQEDVTMSWNAGGTWTAYLLQNGNDDYTLFFDGTGALVNYTATNQPWSAYKTKISTVYFGEGITKVGNSVCESMTALTRVAFAPNGQMAIFGDSAFRGCTALTALDIPATVQQLGQRTFQNAKITDIVIPNGVTEIPLCCFYALPLSSIDIPDTVEDIGQEAFAWCRGTMTVLRLPDSVKTIGKYAFNKMTTLKYIILPSQLESIEMQAFAATSALKGIWVPASVATMVGDTATHSMVYSSSASAIIYCESASAKEAWGPYWNYRTASASLNVQYGCSRTAFMTAVGLVD